MNPPVADSKPELSRRAAAGQKLAAVIVLWALQWLVLTWRVPIPGVNEPHYLTKAKHYFDPDWCRGDFFLDSSNPHLVFYQTIGWLTRTLTLEQTAWIGRSVVCLLVAIGWQKMVSRILGSPLWSVVAAVPFLLLQMSGNFSGEWLLGGVESKVFAFGLVFWGLGQLLDRRWRSAAILVGLAIAYHPIVGGWSLVCAVGATACLQSRWGIAWQPQGAPVPGVPPPRELLLSAVLLVACALPGVIPALRTLDGSSADVHLQADYLQVTYRLSHHLDPREFSREAYRDYLLLLCLWGLLRRGAAVRGERVWFETFVALSIAIAALGLIAGAGLRPWPLSPLGAWCVRFLKFYPFRLADLCVPLIVSVLCAERLRAAWQATRLHRPAIVCSLLAMLSAALLVPGPDRNPGRMTPVVEADWIEACHWVRDNTPHDALVDALNESWAVKWYAERAEYVNYKDCPQDAAGILEWNRRQHAIANWANESWAGGYSAAELRTLQSRTGITHLIASRFGPVASEPVYRNDTFQVYDLRAER